MLHGSLDGRGVWGRKDTCICMDETLLYLPETITTLLIGYTLIQNKNFKKKLSHLIIPLESYRWPSLSPCFIFS